MILGEIDDDDLSSRNINFMDELAIRTLKDTG